MKLYNTLTRRVENFVVEDGRVNMYVCGITPYAPSHLGHAMCAVVFDIVRRYLEFKGLEVAHIQNFTDIDDKMIAAAKDQGIEVSELAEMNIHNYLAELRALNVLPATNFPRATEEITGIIEIIAGLIQKGYAYEANGDVYFRVRSDDDYGKLSNRNIEELLAGARLEVGEEKEYPGDFVLWKAHKDGEPSWDSPWGMGRPGWHIECSAMSLTYLGGSIDIHGGGLDLVFPHHENEIAQSESYTGVVPFARFWLHNGTLQYGDDKMSKSIGNVFSINEALESYSPDSLRMFFLSSHYRSPLVFNGDAVLSQNRALERLRNALESRSGNGPVMGHSSYEVKFVEAMDQDINTPRALSVLFDLARDINRQSSSGFNVKRAQETLANLSGVLGLSLTKLAPKNILDTQPFVDMIVDIRTSLRDLGQYELADSIRDRLSELDVALEDSPEGTDWKFL